MRVLAVFLFILPAWCIAQPNLDSLWGVWNDPAQPDTNKLEAMKQISWDGYLFTHPDSAFYFAQMQFDLAKKKGEKKYMALALNTQGASFYVKGDYSEAAALYTKSLELFKLIGDRKQSASLLYNIGMIYEVKGNIAQSTRHLTESLKLFEELDYKVGIANCLNVLAGFYMDQDNYSKSIEFYKKALRIREEVGDRQGIASSLNNLGIVYKKQGNLTKAEEYYESALEKFIEIDLKKGIANTLGNLGNIYSEQGLYAKAMDTYMKALKIREDISDKSGISNIHNSIGKIHKELGNYSLGMEHCIKSLNIAQEIGALVEIKNAANSLWEINKRMGNYEKALEMFELYISSKDSLESEENQKEVIRQEYKYQYEKQAAADSVKAEEAAKVKDAQLSAEKAENKRNQIEAKQQRQQKYFLYGGLALALVFGGFIFNRFRVTRKQKGVIEEQKEKVDVAYEQLGEKNQEILDSINYAKRIQSAILPPNKIVKKYLENSFVFYQPKDIVAGDFYWMEPFKDGLLFAAADCTGHGVPGAMVSVVCNNALNRSVREHGLTEPAKILDKTREIVIAEFEKSEEEVKDGMDIAICSLQGNQLQYSGAHNPLWIIRKGVEEIEEIKADKQPIGKFGAEQPFTNHTVELQKGDSIYIFSDGYADQFGGEKGKKFKSKNFKRLLLSIQDETMERQRRLLDEAFENWKRNLEQLDDICVIGVRL